MISKNLKNTEQRKKIIEFLRHSKDHPTAEMIFNELKKQMPNISMGTIYRNLNILIYQGKVHEVYTGDAKRHFDGNPTPHSHFICERCGKIYDIEKSISQFEIESIQRSIPHHIFRYKLEFYGICSECSKL